MFFPGCGKLFLAPNFPVNIVFSHHLKKELFWFGDE
jgi:hypothetical protein